MSPSNPTVRLWARLKIAWKWLRMNSPAKFPTVWSPSGCSRLRIDCRVTLERGDSGQFDVFTGTLTSEFLILAGLKDPIRSALLCNAGRQKHYTEIQ